MFSILPEELHDDVPAGFNVAGHVGMSALSVRHVATTPP